ncbi:aldo/keto reductase [Myxococcus sp. AM011]|uniref:aldo/keto reductase n=1 Tax=Myxococcus sp. AM011 TaxID=2745200 RepID=UPI0015950A0C|nr:aldo/keto reductase [Myxococcus sp. AM011]NVJ26245.1 aldo/keto reductase [Myxococcus sp. AM011]
MAHLTGAGDFGAHPPRLSGEHREKNEDVVGSLQRFARERQLSPAPLAVACVLARQPGFIPVIGVKNLTQLEDAPEALNRPLASSDVAALEVLATFSVERHGPEQMGLLDGERRSRPRRFGAPATSDRAVRVVGACEPSSTWTWTPSTRPWSSGTTRP